MCKALRLRKQEEEEEVAAGGVVEIPVTACGHESRGLVGLANFTAEQKMKEITKRDAGSIYPPTQGIISIFNKYRLPKTEQFARLLDIRKYLIIQLGFG